MLSLTVNELIEGFCVSFLVTDRVSESEAVLPKVSVTVTVKVSLTVPKFKLL